MMTASQSKTHGLTGSLFEPDTILPWQMDNARQRRHSLQPERQLMFAVLDDAVNTYCRYLRDPNPRERRAFAEAEGWFVTDDPTWPFSFVNICQALDLDVSWVRSRLDHWREAAAERLARVAS